MKRLILLLALCPALMHAQTLRTLVLAFPPGEKMALSTEAIRGEAESLWSDLSLADVVRRSSLRVDYQFKLSPIDLWQIVVMSDGSTPLSPPVNGGQEPMGEPAVGQV